jgi:putative glutamine amidotransferase
MDSLELYLARKAVELGIPVLGICRGIQVINVAFGGTLYQDIQAQVRDREVIKHSQSAPVWYPTHEIIIDKSSKVSEAFGSERAVINSFHHQAVKEPASEFKVTSRASDGIIESIEYCGDLFAVGVQWHPELMWQEDRIHLRLFENFVKAAARRMASK